jgi:hypothetical protein
MGIENRRFPRFNVDIEVTVLLESGLIEARIKNLSRGGCLIYPPLPLTPNSEIRLSFLLPDGSTRIACVGEIVYTIHDRGTGIAFTAISLHNQEQISEYFETQPAAL